ncbi:hypothetical protein B0H14DRAFT_2580619 [Mycena olivaceomarginata]|nr:hypothetical protein B0H14DRAFT_2580619 [Mycena olivaceomarginata]
MVNIPVQEICRRFTTLVQPDYTTNVHQQEVIRKVVEYFGLEYVKEHVGQLTRLHTVMGTANTFYHFGKLKINFPTSTLQLTCHSLPQIRNDHLVTRETDTPPLEIQIQLCSYLNGYDTYFMKRGNKCTVRNQAAKSQLQVAEQAWHNFIVPSLAARGLGPCPDWALAPLPRLQMVRVAPAPALAATPACALLLEHPPLWRHFPGFRWYTLPLPPPPLLLAHALLLEHPPLHSLILTLADLLPLLLLHLLEPVYPDFAHPSLPPSHRLAPFPNLPTPPPSSPACSTAPDVAATPTSTHHLAPFPNLPTPPPSSPTCSTAPDMIDLTHIDDPPRRAPKRRFPEVIDVFEDKEDVETLRNKSPAYNQKNIQDLWPKFFKRRRI